VIRARGRGDQSRSPPVSACRERVFLFCLASNTDWQRAGVTHTTAQQIIIRGLVEREGGAGTYVLTDEGRVVFTALLARRSPLIMLIHRSRLRGPLLTLARQRSRPVAPGYTGSRFIPISPGDKLALQFRLPNLVFLDRKLDCGLFRQRLNRTEEVAADEIDQPSVS
jgi:hypothetical protein